MSIKLSMTQGIHRGIIEFRQNASLVFNYTFFPSLALGIMYFFRGQSAGELDISIGHYAMPGIISVNILFAGMMGMASTLMSEREDGTLMRLRGIPFGIKSYFVGKVVSQSLLTIVAFITVLSISLFLFAGVFSKDPASLVNLLWILPLIIVTLVPFGVTFGALIPHPRHLSFISLFLLLITATSGVFYPLTEQSQLFQTIGQCSPLYWMGHLLRFAMLPATAESAELAGQWHISTAVVTLVTWAIIGSSLGLWALKKISPYPPTSRSRSK